jgi:endoglucanase
VCVRRRGERADAREGGACEDARRVRLGARERVDGAGRAPLLLKGINLGNWLLPEGYMFKFKSANSPRLIETVFQPARRRDGGAALLEDVPRQLRHGRDIRFIKRSGFNSVRVAFSYRLFVSEGEPPRLEGVGYEMLDRVVGWCRREGLYVVLDMHGAPGGQTGDNIDDSWGYPFLFESPESQDLTVGIWQKLAARYRERTGRHRLRPAERAHRALLRRGALQPQARTALQERIVAGIRRVDTNHVIFLGGAQWDTNFKVFGPPFDPKLAYTFHKYWMEVKQEAVQEYVDFSRSITCRSTWASRARTRTSGSPPSATLLERNRIGWCFWPYKKLDATSCVVSINKPADWDAVVAFADHPRTTFEDVRKNRPRRRR